VGYPLSPLPRLDQELECSAPAALRGKLTLSQRSRGLGSHLATPDSSFSCFSVFVDLKQGETDSHHFSE